MRTPEILASAGIRIWRAGESTYVTEGWVGAVCPWCDRGAGRPGLGFPINGHGRGNCWRCGPHSLYETLVAYGTEPKRAYELAGGQDRGPAVSAAPRGKLELPAGVGPLLPVHRNYLAGRGFDPDELVERWGIGGIGLAVHFAFSVYIPIYQDGEQVSWNTRVASDAVPHTQRYRGARRDQEAVPRGEVLYGEEYCRHGVVVHEGPTDVFATGPGSVCTAGLGFSRGQVRRLARFPLRAICFDAEPGAQRRARKLADQLASMPGETFVVQLTTGKDSASADDSEVAELRKRFLE